MGENGYRTGIVFNTWLMRIIKVISKFDKVRLAWRDIKYTLLIHPSHQQFNLMSVGIVHLYENLLRISPCLNWLKLCDPSECFASSFIICLFINAEIRKQWDRTHSSGTSFTSANLVCTLHRRLAISQRTDREELIMAGVSIISYISNIYSQIQAKTSFFAPVFYSVLIVWYVFEKKRRNSSNFTICKLTFSERNAALKCKLHFNLAEFHFISRVSFIWK